MYIPLDPLAQGFVQLPHNPSWTTSYVFRAQFRTLIEMYLNHVHDKAVRLDVGHRLTALVRKYCPDCTSTTFGLRRQQWRDVYPRRKSRWAARLAYILIQKEVVTDVRWYHLLLGYQMWVRFDFSHLSARDFKDLPLDIDSNTTDPDEATIISLIEKNVRLRPTAYLRIPSTTIICEVSMVSDAGETSFSIPLNIGQPVTFVD